MRKKRPVSPDTIKTTTIHVTDENLVGLKASEFINKLHSGIGKPDPLDSKLIPNQERKTSLQTPINGTVGGLRTYLQEEIGKGYWDFIEISPGLMISITDATYYKPHKFTFPQEQILKIRAICSGEISTSNQNMNSTEGTAHFQFAEFGAQTDYIIHPDKPLRMVGIIVMPEIWRNLGIIHDTLPESILRLLGSDGDTTVLLPINSCSKLIRIAREIIESRKNFPSELRLTYIKGKSMEFFCEALQHLKPETECIIAGKPLQQKDIALLHEVKNILTHSMEEPPTIEQLSRLIGINRTKLKLLFRGYFGETIHDYRTRIRMEKAKQLLVKSELQIGEIAIKIGFQHPCNFTQAIKRYFGMGPKEIQKEYVRRQMT